MQKFIKLLEQFVEIQSVSADLNYKKEVGKGAKFLFDLFKTNGFKTKIINGPHNPLVFASTPTNPKFKTILVYGHYDVQPARKEDGWKTEPFKLTRKGKIFFGRGSSDNKCQILTHIFCVSELFAKGGLGYNVKFIVEGNEETGSPNLAKTLIKIKKDLSCDCIIISDGELGRKDSPALEASFRGVANMEVSLRTAEDDVHSGLFGGLQPNAAEELSNLLSKIHGPKRKILVSGFYTDVKNQGKDPAGLEPAIEITSFVSGYQGEGFRNSIPCIAKAKINVRSAPNQDPKKLADLLKKFLIKNKPKFAKIKFGEQEIAPGAELELNNQFAKRSKEILEKIFNQKVVEKHSGGTLPIVNDFAKILKVPQVMVPLANENCGAHSASENVSLFALKKGLEFSTRFFSK